MKETKIMKHICIKNIPIKTYRTANKKEKSKKNLSDCILNISIYICMHLCTYIYNIYYINLLEIFFH